MTTTKHKIFGIDHTPVDEVEGVIELILVSGSVGNDDIERYIDDYSLEKGVRITVYELVPVATYEVSPGFKKVPL